MKLKFSSQICVRISQTISVHYNHTIIQHGLILIHCVSNTRLLQFPVFTTSLK